MLQHGPRVRNSLERQPRLTLSPSLLGIFFPYTTSTYIYPLTCKYRRPYPNQRVLVQCQSASTTTLPLPHNAAHAGLAIAQALQLNYLFFSEFEELRSPARDARTQGGGVHGNAILTKYDVSDVCLVQHR